MVNYIGHNGYPQPEIVAIATGKPNSVSAAAVTVATIGNEAFNVDHFDIKFGTVLQQEHHASMSVVDLTNLDTITEADDSVEM